MTTISYSEVEVFSRCKREWYYGYAHGIQPKSVQKSEKGAAAEGTRGHTFLQKYFNLRQAGTEHGESVIQVMNYAGYLMAEKPEAATTINKALDAAMAYLEANKDYYLSYDVVATEKVYIFPITETLNMGMTADLILKGNSGNLRGEYVVKDFKFVAQRYPAAYVELHTQIPIYIYALKNFVGLTPCNKGALEFIDRTYNKFIERKWFVPSKIELNEIWREFMLKAEELEEFKIMPIPWQQQMALRTPNRVNCAMCYFNTICSLERKGADISSILVDHYEERTYGYEDQVFKGNNVHK